MQKDYLSLLDLSPYCSFVPGRLHLVLKAYLDSSQDERGIEFMTLGCIVSSEAIWPDFEQAWSSVLDKAPHPLKSFHMAPAMSRKTHPFNKDWTKDQVDELVDQLLMVIHRFAMRSFGREFVIKTATLNLTDYRRFKLENIHLRRPEAICVNFCCGTPLPTDKANPEAELQDVIFYFDRQEKFLRTIRSNWIKGKKYLNKNQHGGWPKQFKEMLPLSAEDIPALQAVDVVAWITNGRYKGDDRAKRLFPKLFFGRMTKVFDYKAIKEEYAGDKKGTDPYAYKALR